MLTLGDEIQRNGQPWRVVRIVSKDLSLFEDETGIHVIEETYAMLKSGEGRVEFEVLASQKVTYTGPSSTIKALNPLSWRQQ